MTPTKTIVITGANSGIGRATAEILAVKGYNIITICRKKAEGEKTVAALLKINPKINAENFTADLSDLEQVAKTAHAIKEKYTVIDRLINNAGVMVPPYSKTVDGFELQFGTNHLGHFALTAGLMSLLQETKGSRIVNVASSAEKFGRLDFDDLTWEKRQYKAWRAYGDSKIANLYFTYELNRRLKGSGSEVIITAAHPVGALPTLPSRLRQRGTRRRVLRPQWVHGTARVPSAS